MVIYNEPLAFYYHTSYNLIIISNTRTGGEVLRLTINQSLDNGEPEIIINCSVMDARLQKLVDIVRQYTFSLKGIDDGCYYNIPLENILYIDSVDGRTFLYCNDQHYECKDTLAFLENLLLHSPFVRISKNCIMNTSELKSVKSTLNHRMEAYLKNGEKLIVNRNYIEGLKKKLEQ